MTRRPKWSKPVGGVDGRNPVTLGMIIEVTAMAFLYVYIYIDIRIMIYFIYRISIIVCFGLASLIAVWCSVGFSFLRRGSHLELVMVCFRNSIEKFLKIMSLGILESLPSGHVCHVFATVYIYNISYLSTYCTIQTKITMQTSRFRAMMCSQPWVKVEDWWKCPVNPFCGRKNSPFNRPQHPSADWSAHAFATAKQIF